MYKNFRTLASTVSEPEHNHLASVVAKQYGQSEPIVMEITSHNEVIIITKEQAMKFFGLVGRNDPFPLYAE